MFPFFLDAGRVLVSPWGGGYTFSEPGMKKVAAEFSVILQLVKQQKMCYGF